MTYYDAHKTLHVTGLILKTLNKRCLLAETLTWSTCREYETIECSVVDGTYISYLSRKGTSRMRGRKIVRARGSEWLKKTVFCSQQGHIWTHSSRDSMTRPVLAPVRHSLSTELGGWAWNLLTSWEENGVYCWESWFCSMTWPLVGWPHSRQIPAPQSCWASQTRLDLGGCGEGNPIQVAGR